MELAGAVFFVLPPFGPEDSETAGIWIAFGGYTRAAALNISNTERRHSCGRLLLNWNFILEMMTENVQAATETSWFPELRVSKFQLLEDGSFYSGESAAI